MCSVYWEPDKEILQSEKENGLKESDVRVRMLTNLNTRECLLRLSAGGQILPCAKARTVDWKASTPSSSLATLKEFDQPSQPLSKFIERPLNATSPPSITQTSVKLTGEATVSNLSTLPLAAGIPNQPALQVRPVSTLAELLASQSSSRKQVTR